MDLNRTNVTSLFGMVALRARCLLITLLLLLDRGLFTKGIAIITVCVCVEHFLCHASALSPSSLPGPRAVVN